MKREGIWRIPHFRNTTVDLEAEKNDPITWDESDYLPGGKTSNDLDESRKKP